MQSSPMAVSLPQSSGPSLCNIPAELRLEICTFLLDANNIPRSYGYTGPRVLSAKNTHAMKLPPRPPHQHAMLYVSQQFSAEYRQCYYERTTFFLRIDRSNAIRALAERGSNNDKARVPDALPNFWNAPDALLGSLRNCTLYIEIGDIDRHFTRPHNSPLDERRYRYASASPAVFPDADSPSNGDIGAQEALYDGTFRDSVLSLLPQMRQLRSVQLVWDITQGGSNGLWDKSSRWTWESLGEPVVDCLKQKETMRGISVKVGDAKGHTMWRGKRDEGVWQGELEEWDPGHRRG